MIFNSPVFLIFITIFFAFWPLLRKWNNTRWIYITLASFLFYGWWDWRFLFLLIGSGLIDYFTALGMEAMPTKKKVFLYLSLVGNLGSLFIFKYSGFVAYLLDKTFLLVHISAHLYDSIPSFALILPIGISFYTFQSLNYTIDVYQEKLKPAQNIFHFFAYLSLFPHLVAGPILRARQMIPQMMRLHLPTDDELWDGLKLIAVGFFRKMVIADNLAPFVNSAFNDTLFKHNSLYWWVAVILFAFQIFYDFSGYSNIAIGLLRWMGYYVPANFNHPYWAISLRDFWQRWHISLSTWFRDYVYIPLGGSKSTGWRGPNINMWITMLLSGFWHGASFNFIIWGGIHAFFLNIERVTKWSEKLSATMFGRLLSHNITMLQVLLAWVFFRAGTFGQGVLIVKTMLIPTFADASSIGIKHIILLALAFVPELPIWWRIKLTLKSTVYMPYLEMAVVIMLLVMSVFMRGPGSQFIYFQF